MGATDDRAEDAALFELRPEWRRVLGGTSATRTQRQRFMISVGLHPLTLKLRHTLRLYPATASGPLLTCGTCAHLGKLDWAPPGGANVSDLKCWFDQGKRVSRGRATTVRRWWPACRDYEGTDDRASSTTDPGPT